MRLFHQFLLPTSSFLFFFSFHSDPYIPSDLASKALCRIDSSLYDDIESYKVALLMVVVLVTSRRKIY